MDTFRDSKILITYRVNTVILPKKIAIAVVSLLLPNVLFGVLKIKKRDVNRSNA